MPLVEVVFLTLETREDFVRIRQSFIVKIRSEFFWGLLFFEDFLGTGFHTCQFLIIFCFFLIKLVKIKWVCAAEKIQVQASKEIIERAS